MNLEIRQNQSYETWSETLNEYNYSLFITHAWVESLTNSTKKPIYLDFFSGDTGIAKIAGFSFDSGLFWQRKLLFYAGPALKSNLPETSADKCIDALLRYAKKYRYSRVVLLSYDYPYSSINWKMLGLSERSEFIIDLLQEKETINKSISRESKRLITRAIEYGFVFKESCSSEMTGHLIKLMQETKRIRLSKGYGDYNYFYFPGFNQQSLENLVRKEVIHFYTVEKDSEIYAVQAVMQDNQKAYALFIGVNAEGYRFGVPSFIDYSIISLLRNNHYKYLNFGGVPTQKTHQGLIHFKKSLGAKQQFSSYGSTNFLVFPYTLLNPVVRMIRKIPGNALVDYIKKVVHI
jgi:hypothetical protein